MTKVLVRIEKFKKLRVAQKMTIYKKTTILVQSSDTLEINSALELVISIQFHDDSKKLWIRMN